MTGMNPLSASSFEFARVIAHQFERILYICSVVAQDDVGYIHGERRPLGRAHPVAVGDLPNAPDPDLSWIWRVLSSEQSRVKYPQSGPGVRLPCNRRCLGGNRRAFDSFGKMNDQKAASDANGSVMTQSIPVNFEHLHLMYNVTNATQNTMSQQIMLPCYFFLN
jgi:hypothetical protein